MRILIRKTLYFEKRMARKGPTYADCSIRGCESTRREHDPRHGCPKCEYVIQYKLTEKEIEAEFSKGQLTPHGGEYWPLDTLRMNLSIVSRANSERPKGYKPSWTITLTRLIEIYRDEISKMRAADSFKALERMKARSKALREGRDEDDDDED